jgi:DNA-binding CsgD family transcriptional regulator
MISSAPGLVVDIAGRRWNRPDQPERRLTPHEIRIIGMLAGGDSYQEVGDRLGVTVNTVRNHIRSIYDKLQVHTKSEAVSKALRARIIY